MRRIVPLAVAASLAACAGGPGAEGPVISDSEVQAIMKRDFHPRGQATMDRLEQDAVQRVCTATRDHPPADVAERLRAEQMKTIKIPSGNLIGDWREGDKIAWSGRGMQWNEDPKKPGGGGCYNCHEISPTRTSFGTIGPSLRAFGKTRGNGPEVQRYVYSKIYNAKAFVPCSEMPRFGYTGSLTEQQIKDLVGYLLDPESPVNR
jgi:sulfur-oxidizing protein SoxX